MTSVALDNHYVIADDALDALFREARTANTFSDEPVTPEQIEAIYELVKMGPTMMNIQPMRLLVVASDEAKQRLLPHMAEGNRAKTATAPVVLVVAADQDFHERIPELFPHRPEAKEMFGEPEGRAHVARYNAALQTGYLITGIRAAGLAAGPMGGFDAAGIDAEFFEGTTWRTQLVINVGHPGENPWFDRLPRLSHDDAVRVA